jgi:xylulokinase
VVEPKDYLNFRLTGRLAGDTVASARLAAAATAGLDGRSILGALGLPETVLAPLQEPVSIVFPVRAGLPGALARLAGRPVAAMANDTWAAVAGLGALRVGAAYNISGTSEVFGIVAGTPACAEGLMDVVWGDGLHQLGGPGQNGAETLTWAIDLLGRGRDELEDEILRALDAPPPAAPLLFLPYLQGERTPFWDANLRGALLGLDRGHMAADVARAVMEGVAFVNRIVLERAEAAAGLHVREIRFGGGGAASAAWCRIKADILGRDVAAMPGEEAGLSGAALVARVVCGEYPTLAAAQDALARPARRWSPDPARAAHYSGLFAAFADAHAAVGPLSRRLATWAADRR